MANPEHVKELREGSRHWLQWRMQNPKIQPDLSKADLSGVNLRDIHLVDANLSEANLSGADLLEANLNRADLSGADLSGADLSRTDLTRANLSKANLRAASLIAAKLIATNLSGTDLSGVVLFDTNIAKVDLRTTKGLSVIQHVARSSIELFSIWLPQDGSALHFLRGVGVPEEWIDDYRAHMMHPIQYYSCFISYSSNDEMLAKRLHADLQVEGVRCWFAPEDMKIGDPIRQSIDEAIHLQDKLLLLLSENSIASNWVRDEVDTAFEKEQRQQREVLFPIRLDNAVMQTAQAWAATLRRSRHIGDFSEWKDPQAYQAAFARLLRDLKQE